MMNHNTFKRLLNIYPPYIGAGVRVKHLSPDYREIHVEMNLRWYNRNYMGTHFGGSLFSMIDPFYALMLIKNLGEDYIVWDRSASIRFVRPGKGTVSACFILTSSQLEEIMHRTESGEKYLPEFSVDIMNSEKKVVAKAVKTLYIKKKADN